MSVTFTFNAQILTERMNADWSVTTYTLTQGVVTIVPPTGQTGFSVVDWGAVEMDDYNGSSLTFSTPTFGTVNTTLGNENPMFIQVLDHDGGRTTLLVLDRHVRSGENLVGFDMVYIPISGAALPSFASGEDFALWRNAAVTSTTVSVTDVYPAGTVFNWESFDIDAPVNGGTGADTMVGTTGDDTLNGLAGNDLLQGDRGNDVLSGGDGHDTLAGAEGLDTLSGGLGNDVLRGGLGNETDRIDGGGGMDTADYSDLTLGFHMSGLTVDLAAGTTSGSFYVGQDLLISIENANGTGGGDTLTGSAVANLLRGLAGNDKLSGGAGADTLDAGSGTDTLIGGAGDDLFLTDGGDTITEATASGTDTVRSSVTHSLANNVENLILTGTGNLNGTGNGLANRITGNAGANSLNGGTGDDTLIGAAGADILTGGTGKDSLSGGDGIDKLSGGAGSDKLTGGAGGDAFIFNTTLSSTGNVDTITDFARVDVIHLEKDIFTAIGGSLTTSEFKLIASGTSFATVDASDHIIYQRSTGKIFYDRDGSGSAGRVLFAQLDANTALALDDFLMV